MTDRELLELAAKAAGYNAFPGHAAQMMDSGWNPLEDDGDALRLAVTLGLIVDIGLDEHVTAVDYTTPLAEDGFVLEGHFPDRCAATRRAIVRAAAEIGRSMS